MMVDQKIISVAGDEKLAVKYSHYSKVFNIIGIVTGVFIIVLVSIIVNVQILNRQSAQGGG